MTKSDNKLTFLNYTRYKLSGKKFYRMALYECECGEHTEKFEHNVKADVTRSCGCAFKNMDRSYQRGLKRNRPSGLKYKN